MRINGYIKFICGLLLPLLLSPAPALAQTGWSQWGQNQQHHGFVRTEGQDATSILADKIYDPFTAAEERDTGGELLVHYQVPLVEGNDVFMEFKTGRFIECNPPGSGIPPAGETDCGQSAWNSQIWNQRRLHWEDGHLVEKWNFQSDWKAVRVELAQWEPVYHAVLANGFVYDPGFGGSVFKLNRGDGTVVTRISPFGSTLDPNTFVAGPLSADSNGNVYYNAIKFTDQTPGFYPGLVNSWLVKIAPDDTVSLVSYPTLLASVNPPSDSTCERAFSVATLPWPPSPTSVPRLGLCGAQRPGLNIAPAIGPDGTIYTASRGHFPSGDRAAYVVAVNPNLTLKWAKSLIHTLNTGCGVLVPIATQDVPPTPPFDLATFKGKCRKGANVGVDPSTNRLGDGRILDSGTSSPVVLPDGNIYFGAYTRYNIARGHAYKLRGSDGGILATFDFGWDDTQAVLRHGEDDDGEDGSSNYSIVMKDNHYDEEGGFYCNTDDVPVSQGGNPNHFPNVACDFTGIPAGPFYITQVDSNLNPEWKFKSTETRDCHRNADGSITCVNDGRHPNGFEWCINAPAVDGDGNVYVESEDGNIYVLDQGHSGIFTTPKFKLFTNLAVGAAYTPFSIDQQGRLYGQNNGHLFVLGEGGDDVGQNDEGNGPHSPKRFPETDRD
jgi:outer membrane protein assembly factor BamB